MAIDFECACGKKLKSKDDYAGKKTKCPVCGAVLTVPLTTAMQAEAAAKAAKSGASAPAEIDAPLAIDMSETSVKIEPISAPASTETVAVLHTVREPAVAEHNGDVRQYRVLTSKDMGFFAKFDSVKLEETLNSWARQGWTVRTVMAMTHTSHSGVINDLLVVLEK